MTARVFETQRDELAWLAEAVREAHGGPTDERWSDIGVLTRDNAHAAEVFDALTDAGIPVEIVGLSGLLRLPEVAEVVAVLHLLKDVTANASLLTLLTGPRWAIGPRDLKLLGDRARELAGGAGRGAAAGVDRRPPGRDRRRHRPGRDPVPRRRARRPGRRGLLRRRRWSGSRCSPASCGCCARTSASRCSTSSGGSSTPPASTSSSPRPSARPRPPGATTSTSSSGRSPTSRPSTATSTLVALLAYLTAEDEESKGLEVVAPSAADSVKLLTVHRAKGLEWAAVFLVGVCVGRFPSNRSRTLWTSSPAVLPAPLRGDAADLPQLRGYDKAALDAVPRRHPGARGDRRSCGSATSRSPAPRTGSRSRRSAGARGRRRSVRRPTRCVVRDQLRGVGRAGRRAGSTPRSRATPTPTPPRTPSRPWPPTGIGAEAQRRLDAAALVRAADPTARGRRPRHDRGRPGRRLGRRARAAARRGAARAQRRDRRTAAGQPVGDRAAPAARGPGRVRPRAGPADAAAAVAARPGSAPCSTPGSRPASASSRCSTPTTCPAGATSTSTTRPTSTT